MNSYPGDIRNGAEYAFDPPVVSHWSQWLGDTSPRLLIVGQDFGDISYFEQFRGLDDPESRTNENLFDFLVEAGFKPKPPPMEDTASGVFLTNSILCFKTKDGMSGLVRPEWSRMCTRTHLEPLINLLKPRAIVAMGGLSWSALRSLFQLRSSPPKIMKAAGKHWTTTSAELFAVGHCGGLGLRNRRKEIQMEDWRRIGNFLEIR
jgi:uracil-DNA glycosylase